MHQSRQRRRLARPSGEDGMVTALVVIFLFALVLFAGLVLDGGLTLAARIQAISEAQAAARAGAQEVNLALYRATGEEVLDPAAATAAAESYLAATGHPGVVTVTGDQVSVTVSITQPMQILEVADIHAITVTGRGAAQAELGVSAAAP
ncbi:MAG: pilus assembly protein TadG-related protein [Mycobacteriales bacterium]